MAGVYVHSQGKTVRNKMLKSNGIQTDETQKEKAQQKELEPVQCMRCAKINSAGAKFCMDCGAIIDLRTAFKLQDATRWSSDVLERTFKEKGSISKELIKEVLKEMMVKGEL